MEHIHNNSMKLGGSLGNVPQKLKKLVIITPICIHLSLSYRVDEGFTEGEIGVAIFSMGSKAPGPDRVEVSAVK
jgi:hypothetical protein